MTTSARSERSNRGERGAAAVMVSLITCFVLFAVAALTVDLGNTWARRGSLQAQADRAAKFAAEKLPVDTTTVGTPTASQLGVAKAVAYYLACHSVPGQDDVATIPACPSAATYTTDSGINTFARALLTNGTLQTSTTAGKITFPAVNKVSVTPPSSRVEFGFGKVAGADDSVQSSTATAVVLSPGEVVPIGLSLSCMANALGTAPLGVGDTASTVMPVNYVSTGSGALVANPQVTISTDSTPTYWGDLYQGGAAPATISLNTAGTSINNTSGAVTLVFNWSSSRTGWTPIKQQIFIRRAGYVAGGSGAWEGPLLLGTTSPTAPLTLRLPPGNYEALIRVTGLGPTGQTDTWTNNSNNNAKFTIPDVGLLAHHIACARPAQSPRLGVATEADAMSINIAQGIDHGLQAYPGLTTAVENLNIGVGAGTAVSTASSLLNSSTISALACGSGSSVKKDYPTRRTDGANCVRVDTNTDWSSAVTKGLLTGGSFATGTVDGRLKCPSSGSCNFKSARPTLSAPGGIAGTYNDDHFSDFIKSGSTYTSDPFLMSLDLMISSSVPLVTPPNTALDTALYNSPRFFWAPFLVTAYPTTAAADYSIQTFRPVFLTSDSSSTITTPIDTLLLGLVNAAVNGGLTLVQALTSMGASSSCLLLGATACEKSLLTQSDISGALTSYLGSNTVTTGGLVIDKAAGRVRAARIMTLAPGALPAVAREYNGPTTDYLGVGPKIIRLTK